VVQVSTAVLSFAFYSHIDASETFPCSIGYQVCFKCHISVDSVFFAGGWRTFEIGVFQGSFGGVTKCLHIT
jgi:hypothetical protein